MEDITPTLEKLEQIKSSLGGWVNRIYQEVPFTSLNKDAILRVQKHMGINFSQETTSYPSGYKPVDEIFGPKSDITHYDIGYRLIKDQLERESLLPPDEKRMLFDGVMGWLYYNPGTKHDEEMNRILLQYVDKFGVDRLNIHFKQIFERFNSLISLADKANKELERTYKDKRELSYWTLFTQCGSPSYLSFRRRDIAKIIPNFSTNVEIAE